MVCGEQETLGENASSKSLHNAAWFSNLKICRDVALLEALPGLSCRTCPVGERMGEDKGPHFGPGE